MQVCFVHLTISRPGYFSLVPLSLGSRQQCDISVSPGSPVTPRAAVQSLLIIEREPADIYESVCTVIDRIN